MQSCAVKLKKWQSTNQSLLLVLTKERSRWSRTTCWSGFSS